MIFQEKAGIRGDSRMGRRSHAFRGLPPPIGQAHAADSATDLAHGCFAAWRETAATALSTTGRVSIKAIASAHCMCLSACWSGS